MPYHPKMDARTFLINFAIFEHFAQNMAKLTVFPVFPKLEKLYKMSIFSKNASFEENGPKVGFGLFRPKTAIRDFFFAKNEQKTVPKGSVGSPLF